MTDTLPDTLSNQRYTVRRTEGGHSFLIVASGGLAIAAVPGHDETTRQRAEMLASGPEALDILRGLVANSVVTQKNARDIQRAKAFIAARDAVEIG